MTLTKLLFARTPIVVNWQWRHHFSRRHLL